MSQEPQEQIKCRTVLSLLQISCSFLLTFTHFLPIFSCLFYPNHTNRLTNTRFYPKNQHPSEKKPEKIAIPPQSTIIVVLNCTDIQC